MGAPAKSFRMALGALITKEILGVSDREVIEQIKENPYLQYFIGLTSYSNEAPFEASLLVHFRKRISTDTISKINKRICTEEIVETENLREKDLKKKEEKEQVVNKGKLIIDASCSPADISYPQDLKLLNQTREKLEKIIDILYISRGVSRNQKPRTYRKKARKKYLAIAKKRRVSHKERRKGIRQQLGYIRRNLKIIEELTNQGADLKILKKKEYKNLLVAQTIYEQQEEMFRENKRSVTERIVSIGQPHVRPIVRGKAGKEVEFGAKIVISCRDGFVFLDHLSWSNFNEATYLKEQIERYKQDKGYYPESVHVDKIYRNRENRKWCKERGIRISGPKLGRPALNISKEEKKQAVIDERIRNEVEGKFGVAKRRYGLNLVMTKLAETSETAIAITFLAMNLMTLVRRVMMFFLVYFIRTNIFSHFDNFCLYFRNKSIILNNKTKFYAV